MQRLYDTERRAQAFYHHQVLDRLNDRMCEFIAQREMMFLSTSDAQGNCDASIRTGPPGFVYVVDEHTLAYPEYRGNGVMASLGNLSENPHIGLLFVDFFGSTVGCHVNGTARAVDNQALLDGGEGFPTSLREMARESLDLLAEGRKPERWVIVQVEEAYIHCSKHIPRLAKCEKEIVWGTDDSVAKGGDFFAAKGLLRPWNSGPETT